MFLTANVFASDFKFVKKDGAISLFERWVEGKQNESVRELKAEFEIKANLNNVVALLKNQQKGKDWNKNASVYKTVINSKSGSWINYLIYDMPSIWDDQDCCLFYDIQDAGVLHHKSLTINFNSISSALFPEKPGIKRITGVKGKWVFDLLKDKIKITYIISSDRMMNIPRFIADPFVHKNLFQSMKSFKQILETM